jgi:hypothetical protein
MLRIMLCGASDTEEIEAGFRQVAQDFDADPLYYRSGDIQHINSRTSSWEKNSRASVNDADLCVFAIVRQAGKLTWSAELGEALNTGKPFLVLCLESTYRTYKILQRSVLDLDGLTNPDDVALVSLLRGLETDRQLTVISYTVSNFASVLRRHLGELFRGTLGLLAERNQRSIYVSLLSGSSLLSPMDLVNIAEIAGDEMEVKTLRKRAIFALAANGGASEDLIFELLSSAEQGVQRLACDQLENLYATRPASSEFLTQCVEVANRADDIGIPRRLVPALLRIDLHGAIHALADLKFSEEGLQRRIFLGIEENERNIHEAGLGAHAVALLDRCLGTKDSRDWRKRCEDLRKRF